MTWLVHPANHSSILFSRGTYPEADETYPPEDNPMSPLPSIFRPLFWVALNNEFRTFKSHLASGGSRNTSGHRFANSAPADFVTSRSRASSTAFHPDGTVGLCTCTNPTPSSLPTSKILLVDPHPLPLVGQLNNSWRSNRGRFQSK